MSGGGKATWAALVASIGHPPPGRDFILRSNNWSNTGTNRIQLEGPVAVVRDDYPARPTDDLRVCPLRSRRMPRGRGTPRECEAEEGAILRLRSRLRRAGILDEARPVARRRPSCRRVEEARRRAGSGTELSRLISEGRR